MNYKRIAIFGYYGFENTGDDAVLQSMLDDIRSIQENLEVVVFSNNPKKTAMQYKVKAAKWDDFFLVSKIISISDLIIIGGGGLYNCYLDYPDNLFLQPNHSYFGTTTFGIPILAALHNKPCMVFGAGASEILAEKAKKDIITGLQACDIITVREEESKEILKALPNGENLEITVTADPVFRLDDGFGYSEIEYQEYLQEILKLPRPIVGVSLRNWPFNIDKVKMEADIVSALQKFKRIHGGSIIFLPFDNGGVVDSLSNDEQIFNRIIEKIKAEIPYYKIEGYLQPKLASRIIRECDICLCMRLHPIVMSIKNLVPVLGLVYDQKVRNIMSMCEIENYAINLDNTTSNEFYERLEDIYLNKERIKNHLSKNMEKIRKKSFINVELAFRLLKNNDINSNLDNPMVKTEY